MTLIFIGGIFVTAFIIACYWAFRSGKAEEHAKDSDDKRGARRKAAEIRAFLAVDDDYAARVRRRFQR